MAITTAGYDGTIDEVQLADMLHRYSVEGPEDFKATTQAGDRIVAIGNGTALGPGTVDVATNLSPIQFNAAPTNTTRWDLVALRRDWQPPGGLSSIVIIEGGAAQAYPAIGTATNQWNRRPGIVDDQPLYLQQVNGTLLGARIDLRCWAGHGGLLAVHTLARDYLAVQGAQVRIGSTIWSREVVNSVEDWVAIDLTQASIDVATFGPGWTALSQGHKPRLIREGRMVDLVGGVTLGATGSVANILSVPTAFQPPSGSTRFVGSGVTSNGSVFELVLSNGVLSIEGGYVTKDFVPGIAVPVKASWPMV